MSALAWLGAAAAVILAVVLAWAAVAKLRSRSATTLDFESLGLPWADQLSLIVPIVELLIAVLLLTWPGWGGVGAFALLSAFTTLLIVVLRSGRVVSCACFGGTTSEPVDRRHLMRNGVLLALAALATSFDGPITSLLTTT